MQARAAWRWFTIIGALALGACVSVEVPPANPQTHLELARDLRRQEDVRGAVAQYRLALGSGLSGERRAQIEGELADCYRDLGSSREAHEHYLRALRGTRLAHLRAEYSVALAELGFAEGNLGSASFYLTEAEKLAPTDPEVRDRLEFGLAALAYEKRALKSARSHLDRVRALDRFRTASLARSRAFHDFVYRSDLAPPGPDPVAPPVAVSWSSRRSWGARALGANHDRMSKIWRITVHHTAMLTWETDRDAAIDSLRRIQRNHQVDNGWADIGYHFLIDRAGRTWEGRKLSVQGAHAGNSDVNQGNIGIALLGNFDRQKPSAEQIEALRGLLVRFCQEHGIQPSNITGHARIASTVGKTTDCPGQNLQILLPSLIRDVRLALSRGESQSTSGHRLAGGTKAIAGPGPR